MAKKDELNFDNENKAASSEKLKALQAAMDKICLLYTSISTLAYGAPPTAKERYLTLMEENPELLQDVPLKYLASYLYITPQSLSRIRAGLRKK